MDENELTVEYSDRSRVVDLDADNLAEFFRKAPRRRSKARPRRYQVGDPVQVFSKSAGEWVDGEVTRT
eukprot:SAG22_NODE_11850_length_466_cov_1.455041_1_plen_67_part_10